MNQNDTFMGGVQRSFPTTIWSDILAAGDPASPEYKARLERLLQTYWKPVYAYVRTAWRKSVEDAKDLTQAFFTQMVEKGYMSRLRPERGSFRGYIKKVLKNFLIDAERADAVRRPGGRIFSLEAAPGELEVLGPAAAHESPERAYDRIWIRCLFDSAIVLLQQKLVQEGKATYFEVFRVYCVSPDPVADPSRSSTTLLKKGAPASPTYRAVATKLNLQETDVRNYLSYCRNLLRQILRERIRDYVASDDDVEKELEEVLSE